MWRNSSVQMPLSKWSMLKEVRYFRRQKNKNIKWVCFCILVKTRWGPDKISQRRMDFIGGEWRRVFVECMAAVQDKERMNGSKNCRFLMKIWLDFDILWDILLWYPMGEWNGRKTRNAWGNNKVTAWISDGVSELDAYFICNGRKMIR